MFTVVLENCQTSSLLLTMIVELQIFYNYVQEIVVLEFKIEKNVLNYKKDLVSINHTLQALKTLLYCFL